MASKKKIRESLIQQLSSKGADKAHFIDLIDDYMRLLDVKNRLFDDIKERGIVSAGAQKSNPSVKEVVGVSKQMLMILDKLGLKSDQIEVEKESDECDL